MDRQWTPQERAEFLADQLAQERRRELIAPVPTGNALTDIDAADRAVEVIEAEWDRLDGEYRGAQAALGTYPSREELAEVVELKRLRDAAWADRQAAVRRRDALTTQLDAVYDEMHNTFHRERGWGLGPGWD